MLSIKSMAMKPCRRILISRKVSPFLGLPLHKSLQFFSPKSSTFQFNPLNYRNFHTSQDRLLNFQTIFKQSQKPFSAPSSTWGQSMLFGNCKAPKKDLYVVSSVASDVRSYSTSVETRVNDKNFERLYVQGGLNVKPLVVEKIDIDENIASNEVANAAAGVEDNVEIENLEGLNVVELVKPVSREKSEVEKAAWKLLENAIVSYCGSPVGTVAANDPNDKQPLNYDQVFIRDFIPSALAFLLKGDGEIVRNFLLHTLQLQSWEKTVDCYSPGQGLMPASFKVRTVPLDDNKFEEVLDPDFGESAIGRVAPVDSGLWWIILLRAYGKITGDYALQERVDVQTGIKLVLNLCLSDGFDMLIRTYPRRGINPYENHRIPAPNLS